MEVFQESRALQRLPVPWHYKCDLSHIHLVGTSSLHDGHRSQMHWHWDILSKILNVFKNQWSPISGEILRQSKIIYQPTHQSQCQEIHFQSGKCLFSVVVQSPVLYNTRCQMMQLLLFYWLHVQNMQRGAVATYFIHNPYPIGSKNCFLFYVS